MWRHHGSSRTGCRILDHGEYKCKMLCFVSDSKHYYFIKLNKSHSERDNSHFYTSLL